VEGFVEDGVGRGALFAAADVGVASHEDNRGVALDAARGKKDFFAASIGKRPVEQDKARVEVLEGGNGVVNVRGREGGVPFVLEEDLEGGDGVFVVFDEQDRSGASRAGDDLVHADDYHLHAGSVRGGGLDMRIRQSRQCPSGSAGHAITVEMTGFCGVLGE